MPTPNMGLTVPTTTVTPGPDYANDVNADLNILDAHDHTPTNGAPVPTAGLNINANLPMNGFALTSLLYGGFSSQGSPLTGTNRVYFSGGNMYVNDGSGNQIQMTAAGSINVSSVGGFSGDYSTTAGVTASYTNATKIFEFFQTALKDAKIKAGDYQLTDISLNSGNAVTLKAPASLASNYTVTMPTAVPGSTLPVQMDNGGALSTPSTAPSNYVPTAAIQDAAVTQAKLASKTVSVSSSSGSYTTTSGTFADVTNLTVTATTTGRPVVIFLQSAASSFGSFDVTETSASFPCTGQAQILRDTSNQVAGFQFGQFSATGTGIQKVPAGYMAVDSGASAGSHTWKVQARVAAGTTGTVGVSFVVLAVYEL
jgi:hypothetical protein